MTKEQFNRIEKYRNQFKVAIKNNFARMSEAEVKEVADMQKELWGISMTKSQMSCSSCRLKMIQRVGKEFFDYEAWYEKKYGNRKGSQNMEDSNLTKEKTVEAGK